jgi:hypothetical protein
MRTPKMTRRKLKTLKLKKNKKSPTVHKMNCFFENKDHNKNRWLEPSQGRQKRRPK